ncbi:unnamed protein product [Schistosoma mattheei]|uniref:Uncharacterized protein n=1 Tax=Schistosoma mattheei TaxID=31246 RepID=A0A3P7X7I1_9TREM|nr:unnamed protein product [Schistosoma mattheei]
MSSFGLCDAVIITPKAVLKSLTPNATIGVGNVSLNKYTLQPALINILVTISAHFLLLCRAS